MSLLSPEEAQTLIFRGHARLTEAMKLEPIGEDAEQKWEAEVLREAREILEAAFKGSLADLVIPPLPVALCEVHKRLNKRRPMKPSDIHWPLNQASSSPWAVWITDEDDPKIKLASHIDLGNPATFWWKDLEERTTRRVTARPALGPRFMFPVLT
ncbi:hypothetical protein OG21DRAFT_781803 [Imleria badia]|nr:hypothetical protein OG21DRAFT_781803 [Imleria badia]